MCKVSTRNNEVSATGDMCPRYSGSTEEKLLWKWGGEERPPGEEDRASEDRGQAGKAGRRGHGMDN